MECKPQRPLIYAVTVDFYPGVVLDTLDTTVQRRRQESI